MSKAVEPKKTAPKEPSPASKPDGKKDGGPSANRLSLPDDDYKSVREQFGADEYCYIMDAKNIGNLGRYLNVSWACLYRWVAGLYGKVCFVYAPRDGTELP